MTLDEQIDAIIRGETPEEYKKRLARIRRLSNERDELIDAIEVLGDDERAKKKEKRLTKVLSEIELLK